MTQVVAARRDEVVNRAECARLAEVDLLRLTQTFRVELVRQVAQLRRSRILRQ